MCTGRVAVVILQTLAAQACGQELVAVGGDLLSHGGAEPASRLVDRLLKASTLQHAELDGTVVGKPEQLEKLGGFLPKESKRPPSIAVVAEKNGVHWDKWVKRSLVAGAAVAAGKVVLQSRHTPKSVEPARVYRNVSTQEFSEPDRLLAKKGRTAAECERAASLYRKLLQDTSPSSPHASTLRVKTADALNAVMRLRTNGNVVPVIGSQDTPEHKKIWAQYGPEAKALSKQAYGESPNDPKVIGVFADAAQFEGSSKGIVKQAVSGGGKEFLANARALQKYPKEEAALGLILEGAFYLAAPWPVKSPTKALSFFKKATDENKSRRNLYYLGLAHYRKGEMEAAKEAWTKSLKAAPGSHNEADVAAYIASQAELGIKQVDR
eukprot:gnl/TRDRNA2_/TRDRNA2_139085_c0_seq1.p1 gnl/TRDRNA2_/TRDRNA2_139085_c0~~gnl/TRDRNA2_/TRDRNA2_139085_c0_seq1.p1  ORF type:complete len:380 (-),score=75.09 gnl/TRDRNA2_/TRDRNA2_139085_c0_seq1:70-1209(-)